MITLGTLFILLMAYASVQQWRGRLVSSPWLLWVLMLAFPFPYIANTLGWMTAELGRQPWLIYGLFHTRDGSSTVVSNGNTIFTLIGFLGLYFVLDLLFLLLIGREIGHGLDEDVVAGEQKRSHSPGFRGRRSASEGEGRPHLDVSLIHDGKSS
jgi:cytochrome d ubiquinol oxidase subunit I